MSIQLVMKDLYSRKILFLFIVSFAFFGCATFGEEVQLGATQEDVEKALGKAVGFHRRTMPNKETREIWVYHDRRPNIKNHLYPDTLLIVFSNGKVVAKNPNDPYGPLK